MKRNETQYIYLHNWVRENFGKADHCSKNPNHKSKQYEWSNISGKYTKNREDWEQLCRSCHAKKDYTESRRKKMMVPVKQYDLNGNYLNKFKSLTEASKFNNISLTAIDNCLNGLCKTSGGYKWMKDNK